MAVFTYICQQSRCRRRLSSTWNRLLVPNVGARSRTLTERTRGPTGDSGWWLRKLNRFCFCFGEGLADARCDTRRTVREHERPQNGRAVPRHEGAEAAVEEGRADGLDVGEVEADAVRGFQRVGDRVVDPLRVNTRAHAGAVVAHPNDRHRRATRCRVPCAAAPCAVSSVPRPVCACA